MRLVTFGYKELIAVSHVPNRLKCPPGHYCQEGTKQQYQSPCSAGTYSRALGLERQDQCLECLQGYYCPAGDQYGDRLCPPGYYCPANTGNYKVTPCDAGYYTEEQGARSKQMRPFSPVLINLNIKKPSC